jgi:N-acyl-D-amino-acid deacylase
MEARPPTREELQRMRALLYQAFDEGALGLSTGLIYPPCSFSDSAELENLTVIASVKEVPLVVHLRSESHGLLEALGEIVEVAKRSKVRIHISHLKIAGAENWGKADRLIEMLGEARRAGVHVSADQYPYTSGATAFSAILPQWLLASGDPLARLRDTNQRSRIRQSMLEAAPDRENLWLCCGAGGIVISDISESRCHLLGKSLAAAAEGSGKSALDFALDLLADEKLGGSIIVHGQSEAVLERLMTLRFVSVCTDGLFGERPHPRTYGAFPRVVARYVRDRKTLTLPEAIRKMTGQTADAFGLREHGYIAEGQRANIVLFDPNKIQDTATFENPTSFPVGINHVLVGGKAVIRDGKLTEERPGQIARVPA